VAFNPDGTRIVSGSNDDTLRLWQIESGEVLSVNGVTQGKTFYRSSSEKMMGY
jgi:WD40 repeat protein